jgi:sigma-E factor negative regulatory protein RseB
MKFAAQPEDSAGLRTNRIGQLARGFCLVMMALVVMGLSAAHARSTDAIMQSPTDAKSLLEGIQSAAKRLNYQGVFSQQRDGVVHSFRMTHRFVDDREEERIEVLDNSPREYLRVDDAVSCLIPEKKLVVNESQRQERFPALLMGELSHFSEFYDVLLAPAQSRVAGRQCLVVDIVPKDNHRPHYQFCADVQTGLLLKAQLLQADGSVLEQIAFNQVQIGHSIADIELAPSWSTDGWQAVNQKQEAIDFRAMGWDYKQSPGFEPVMQLQRTFSDGRMVNQMILTDGLASVSVFIEPYQQSLSQHQWQGASRSGSINLYGKQVGDYWIVVVGEVPAQSIHMLAQSISRRDVSASQ